MKRKISTLIWMLAINFDNPKLLKLARKMETSEEIYSFIFTDKPKKSKRKKHLIMKQFYLLKSQILKRYKG